MVVVPASGGGGDLRVMPSLSERPESAFHPAANGSVSLRLLYRQEIKRLANHGLPLFGCLFSFARVFFTRGVTQTLNDFTEIRLEIAHCTTCSAKTNCRT